MSPDPRVWVTPAPDAPDWAVAYEQNAPRLMRLAVALVGPGDAHDLVADAVLRAVHSVKWSNVSSHGAYLARAVVNLAHDRRLQTSRRRDRELRSVRLVRPAMEETVAEHDAERMLVRSAMASLSAGQLSVVFFSYWEDLTVPQIATQLGVTEGTVRRQLDRAKRKLREALATDEKEPT